MSVGDPATKRKLPFGTPWWESVVWDVHVQFFSYLSAVGCQLQVREVKRHILVQGMLLRDSHSSTNEMLGLDAGQCWSQLLLLLLARVINRQDVVFDEF